MEMTDISTAARQPPQEPPRPRSIVDGILRNYLRPPLVQPKQQDYEVLTEQAVRHLLHESVIDTPRDTKRAFLEARGYSAAQIVDAVKCEQQHLYMKHSAPAALHLQPMAAAFADDSAMDEETHLRQNFSPTLHLPFAPSMPRGKPRGRHAVKCAAAPGDDAHANKSATQGFATPTPKGYATQALANATPCVPSVALKSASQRRKERKKKAARGDGWRQPRLGAWSTSAPHVIGYKVTISKGSCQG